MQKPKSTDHGMPEMHSAARQWTDPAPWAGMAHLCIPLSVGSPQHDNPVDTSGRLEVANLLAHCLQLLLLAALDDVVGAVRLMMGCSRQVSSDSFTETSTASQQTCWQRPARLALPELVSKSLLLGATSNTKTRTWLAATKSWS